MVRKAGVTYSAGVELRRPVVGADYLPTTLSGLNIEFGLRGGMVSLVQQLQSQIDLLRDECFGEAFLPDAARQVYQYFETLRSPAKTTELSEPDVSRLARQLHVPPEVCIHPARSLSGRPPASGSSPFSNSRRRPPQNINRVEAATWTVWSRRHVEQAALSREEQAALSREEVLAAAKVQLVRWVHELVCLEVRLHHPAAAPPRPPFLPRVVLLTCSARLSRHRTGPSGPRPPGTTPPAPKPPRRRSAGAARKRSKTARQQRRGAWPEWCSGRTR